MRRFQDIVGFPAAGAGSLNATALPRTVMAIDSGQGYERRV